MKPAEPPAPPRWGRLALRILGSALILGVLLALVPLGELRDALGRVPPAIWVGALAIYLSLHLIGVSKWRLLMNGAGAGLSFPDTARCYYYGLFGNIFLPSIVGGDVVRAGLAARLSRSRSGVILGSLVDRTLDTAGLAAVAGLGALMVPTALDERSRATFLAVLAFMAVGGAAFIAIVALVPWVRRLPYRIRRKLVTPRRAFLALRRQPGRLVTSLLLGIMLQTLLVLLNAWLGRVMGVDIPIGVWLFVWPLAKIAAILPVTQGGIGVREGALVVLFQPFGVPAAAAMATGLVFTAIVMLGGLVGGVIARVLGHRRAA
ncbi:MAG: lysylphosphatidylglycerol synthase transmembrane domain-containing protein [Gemmatimonadota bacterium]|nr:lysylphosphatidylglycerol synthase transmembrane domain-containing protein [Gemmatimonadota bacterium]